MTNTTYRAYIRCSTKQQSYDSQMRRLNEFLKKEPEINLPVENIVSEKRTGKNQDRPLFKKLVAELLEQEAKGNHQCLILVELSRFGRSYDQTKKTWNELTSAGVDIVVTSFDILDTRKKSINPIATCLSDIVFSILNYLTAQELAEKEERTQNGREAAKAKGVKMGRKELTFDDLPKEFIEVIKRANGTESKTALMDTVNGMLNRKKKKPISRGTFYNYLKIYYNSKA